MKRNQLIQQVYIPPQNATQLNHIGTSTYYDAGANQVVATTVTAPMNIKTEGDFAQEVPYAYEPVKPTTIFLRMDSALLRDIFIEYVRQHNLFITEVARNAVRKKGRNAKDKAGSKRRAIKIRKHLPYSLLCGCLPKQMATQVLLLDDQKPHILWNNLFNAVERYRSNQTMQYPMIPEHWAQTFTVANLRKDPELSGDSPNMEEQASLLAEYMQFLETTYYQSFGMIAEVVTGLDIARIEMITDLDVLKRYFVERLHEDTRSRFLDRASWNGYQSFIYIMRTFADIPPELRGEYTASRFDEKAIEQMQEQARDGNTTARASIWASRRRQSKFMREGQVYRPPGF